jgi:hypothetical protein
MADEFDGIRKVVRGAGAGQPIPLWESETRSTVLGAMHGAFEAIYDAGGIEGEVDTLEDGSAILILNVDGFSPTGRPCLVIGPKRGGDDIEFLYGTTIEAAAGHQLGASKSEGTIAANGLTREVAIGVIEAFVSQVLAANS